MARVVTVLAALATIGLALAGCSTPEAPPTASASPSAGEVKRGQQMGASYNDQYSAAAAARAGQQGGRR